MDQPDILSPNGQRLLTASSSLDLLYELDLDGNVTWSMDLWDTSFNANVLGQRFMRAPRLGLNGALINPDPIELKQRDELKDAVCVLSDPERYNSLGLPTNLTPVFINSISYGEEGKILATSFHRGEAWEIDRNTNRVSVIAAGMKNPHGLHRDPLMGGYIVTDTGDERLSS